MEEFDYGRFLPGQFMPVQLPTHADQFHFLSTISSLVSDTSFSSLPIITKLEKLERDARAGAVFCLNFKQISTLWIAHHAATNSDRKRRKKAIATEWQHFKTHRSCEIKALACIPICLS